MATGLPINLTAADMPLNGESADGVTLPFTVKNTDTTGWTFSVTLWRSNQQGTGPTGDSIGSGSVANTPGSPDSSLVLTVDSAVTTPYAGVPLWAVMRKTNDVPRTLAKGKWVLR